MHRRDTAVARSCRLRAGWFLLLLSAGTMLLSGAPPARGQLDYTGVPTSVPPGDTYVGAYAGVPPGVATQAGGAGRPPGPPQQGGPGGAMSVALDDPAPVDDQGERRLVTGWDLVTMAALGLTAVVAFAFHAGRFRSP